MKKSKKFIYKALEDMLADLNFLLQEEFNNLDINKLIVNIEELMVWYNNTKLSKYLLEDFNMLEAKYLSLFKLYEHKYVYELCLISGSYKLSYKTLD